MIDANARFIAYAPAPPNFTLLLASSGEVWEHSPIVGFLIYERLTFGADTKYITIYPMTACEIIDDEQEHAIKYPDGSVESASGRYENLDAYKKDVENDYNRERSVVRD